MKGLCLTALTLLFTLCSCGKESAPVKLAEDGEALRLVNLQCAIVPRYSGTVGRDQLAELMKKEASAISGMHVHEDAFEDLTPVGKMRFRNIIAELPGRGKDFIIVGAHYDAKRFSSIPDFRAANDGASGVSALFLMMKALSGKKLKHTVRFVFFDGEEAIHEYGPSDGLHGSRHYAELLKKRGELKSCRLMLLLDMIGDSDLLLTLPGDTASDLSKCALESAAASGNSAFIEPNGPVMLDDHIPFQKMGIPSLLLIDFEYGPGNGFWHTPADTQEHVSEKSIRASAEIALEILRRKGAF